MLDETRIFITLEQDSIENNEWDKLFQAALVSPYANLEDLLKVFHKAGVDYSSFFGLVPSAVEAFLTYLDYPQFPYVFLSDFGVPESNKLVEIAKNIRFKLFKTHIFGPDREYLLARPGYMPYQIAKHFPNINAKEDDFEELP